MPNPGQTGKTTQYSEQEIKNQSFDASFGVLVAGMFGYDTTNNVLRRLSVDPTGILNVSIGGVVTPSSGPYLSLPFTLLQP